MAHLRSRSRSSTSASERWLGAVVRGTVLAVWTGGEESGESRRGIADWGVGGGAGGVELRGIT